MLLAPPLRKSPMEQALDAARQALKLGEVPVGAVIVKQGRIIAAAHNLTHHVFDPTGHAEIRAIRMACQLLQSERLPECDLYVTLEPCAMCAAAISFARIHRLYYGAQDEKGGAVENGGRFFTQASCHHVPEIYSGFANDEASSLLKHFFQQRRKHKDIISITSPF